MLACILHGEVEKMWWGREHETNQNSAVPDVMLGILVTTPRACVKKAS